MRTLSWIGLLALPLLLAASTSFQFQSGSSVRVAGTSTLHDWACESEQVVGTLTGSPAEGSLRAVDVTIPVQGLDCKNGSMNSKMREALKSGEHPLIRFALTSAELSTPDAEGAFRVTANGRLTIAGATRPISMDVQGRALGDGGYRFSGEVPLAMTDFGMRPPTAMLGAVKAGDAVTVSFDVVAR